MSLLAPTLQAFFTDRLVRQRQASPRTLAAYRDTFRLLLGFLHRQTGTLPSKLQIADLDAATIVAFLDLKGTETLIRPVSSAFVGSGLSERRLDPCSWPSSTCSSAGWSPSWEALPMLVTTMSRSSSFAISSQSSGARSAI